jgi:hypothetical protein
VRDLILFNGHYEMLDSVVRCCDNLLRPVLLRVGISFKPHR